MMLSISTEDEFQKLLSAKRAIVFMSFDWSKQAELSESVVEEWLRTWNIWHPKLEVPIYKIAPDEMPFMWEWLRSMKKEGGYGSLVWIKNGSVIDYEPFVAAARNQGHRATNNAGFL